MQISTVHKFQHILDTSMKVLKFIWRHVLTLSAVGMIAYGVYHGKTPVISGTSFVFGIAAFIDWFKMQFKFSTGSNNDAREQMFESARRNMDSSRFGSSAWATNPAMAGSPANHLYNLGYTATNYN
jgi:hypothetical protein